MAVPKSVTASGQDLWASACRWRASAFDRRGPMATNPNATKIRPGTIASKAPGNASDSAPPVSPPTLETSPRRIALDRWPASSRRYPMAPLIDPGNRPTVLETLASSGAYPKASSNGNVISDPEPTIVLIVPAARPAHRIAPASTGVIGDPKVSPSADRIRMAVPGSSATGQTPPVRRRRLSGRSTWGVANPREEVRMRTDNRMRLIASLLQIGRAHV